jgi:hypothetical protein
MAGHAERQLWLGVSDALCYQRAGTHARPIDAHDSPTPNLP